MKKLLTLTALLMFNLTAYSGIRLQPTTHEQLDYSGKLLDGDYKSDITRPETFLGFDVGQRVATPEQIVNAITTWEKQSPNLEAYQYATTHEGRPLYYVIISSTENLKNKSQIQKNVQSLANPSALSEAQANQLITELPAIAWMSYSIHGNESSGADAALATIYHLIAAQDAEIKKLLDEQIILIDPMMNPDGRARFAKELQEHRGIAPNIDDQSLLHTGSWPYGRTNHYFFDLNRDFIFATQPESRGRIKTINQWFPQLMIDGHEMGAQDTYLFAPAREPVNPHLPKSRKKWGWKFAQDQAEAFDAKGWPYYTGEWFENLYPGYSNYAEYRGAVHILYEQARIAEDGVKRPEGTVVTYRESVHHQLVSTLTNLKSLSKYSQSMYQDFVKERRQNIASSGRYADRTFAIIPDDNHSRLNRFVDLLQLQKIQFYQLNKPTDISADDQYGGKDRTVSLPKGTLIVPNRQAEARLLATMLEFDADIKKEVLIEERQRTLRDGSSLMYDTTAWNLTMMFGLEAYTIDKHLTDNLIDWPATTVSNELTESPKTIAYAVNGADDNSVAFAARLMELGIQVRVIDKATELSGHSLVRGSVIVTTTDNPKSKSLLMHAQTEANTLNLTLLPIQSGMGEGDLPDWGGQHFRLLTQPQIATLARGGFSFYDVGATWFSIDRNLAIRHSILDSNTFGWADLRRYNVLIMPTHYYDSLSDNTYSQIKTWVENGGTLIAFDNSVRSLIDKEVAGTTLLENSFENAAEFDLSLQREWLATKDDLNVEEVFAHNVNFELNYPWQNDVERLNKEQLETRDKWQKRFMPSGAFAAGRTDQKHWLTFGVDSTVPLLFANNPLLMSNDSTDAVTRLGVLKDASGNILTKLADSLAAPSKAIGWSTLPKDKTLAIRMSGLIWPEAAQRMANAAHTVREQLGKGQIILFATSPNFRGSTYATNRLLLNAIVYGPGLGTQTRIIL
ncbi:M14 family metallopeptidase [Pleionea sediminis]|uniref:M14 family metallopeptidase n=1 Tax=Pleionea sediminis TaxID=2569479 RepID=UPI001184CCEF|nr:M14 family metallopeptidase [Pleionea sediminis]